MRPTDVTLAAMTRWEQCAQERDRLRASNAELITACQELEAAISNWRARAHVSKTDEAQAQTRLNMARAQAGAAIAKAKGE